MGARIRRLCSTVSELQRIMPISADQACALALILPSAPPYFAASGRRAPLTKWRFKMRFGAAAASAAWLLASASGAFAAGASLTPMGQSMNPMVGGQAMMMSKDIVDNAVNSPDHTTLVAAVKAAGLVDTLKGKG